MDRWRDKFVIFSQTRSHNTIKRIEYEENIATNCNDILGKMCDFYTKLYKSSNIDNNEVKSYLDNTTISHTVNDKQKLELEKLPSMEECDEAVK
jgi:hypothetical protein